MIDFFLESVQSYQLTTMDWLLFVFAGMLISVSKAGIKGITILAVPTLAIVFGAKTSTGIMLPILMFLDVLAVYFYTRYLDKAVLLKLLPWTVLGVLLGVWLGDYLNEDQFKKIMAWIVLICVGLLFWWDSKPDRKVPTSIWFAAVLGVGVGFTTMIGNLAGPLMAIYLIAMGLNKNEFIGTGAWLFFIINIFKFPFHMFVWKTISAQSLMMNLALIPALIFFFYLGYRTVKLIKNNHYKKMILVLTAIGALVMFFR